MKRALEWIVDLIYKGATSKERTRAILTPIMGGFFLCIVLSVIYLAFYLDRYFGFPRIISKPWAIIIAMPFLLTGTAAWAWCVGKFIKMKGTPVPINPPPRLITDGPYAYSRNPMLTGVFIFLAGIGILFRSVALVFIMTPIFVLAAVLEFKYIEEPELEKRFGEQYLEYKKKTPMIIPRFRK